MLLTSMTWKDGEGAGACSRVAVSEVLDRCLVPGESVATFGVEGCAPSSCTILNTWIRKDVHMLQH